MKSQDAHANAADESEVKELICNSIDELVRQQPKTKPKKLPTSCELSSCQSNRVIALCYASAGWPVFPIRPTGRYKKTNTKIDATTDQKVISNWWSEHPNAQVGIPTGLTSGLLVLDCNIRDDGAGARELRRLLKGSNVEMIGVPTTKTPDGFNYFYKWPRGTKSVADRLSPHVKVRGEDDYIIAPGSRNAQGITHNWYAGDDPSRCDLQIPPHELLTLIEISAPETTDLTPTAKTDKTLNQSQGGDTPQKNRNSSLTPVDLNLSVKQRNDWLVEDMLFKGDLALLVGKEAVGKSFIAIDLAICLARGQRWAGQKTNYCGVLYLALEGERGITQRFIAQVEKHKTDFENQNVPLAFHNPALDLCHPNAEELLLNATYDFKADFNCTPGLIIIDTLAQAFGGDENSSEFMRACLRTLKAVTRQTGVTFLLIHHFGKDVKNGPRGHSSLAAACDTIFSLEKGEDGIVLKEQKQKDSDCTFKTRVELIPTTLESQRQNSGQPITTCLPSYSNTSKKGVA